MAARRLIFCTDGTWNVPDQKDGKHLCPSNVAKLAGAVASAGEDGTEQLMYYHRGVGTGKFDRLIGGAFGWGISNHICDAYRFLIQHYEPDDEIFLFGFSRGAYIARSIAGLIRNCGVLRLEHIDRITAAYNLYRRRDNPSAPTGFEAELFRKTYAHEPQIKFIGVWDTVGALGIPVGIPWLPISLVHYLNKRWEFHDVQLSRFVENAYHAVAIDERRRQFAPTLWQQQEDAPNQTLHQVWFAGVHTNVGGGYSDSGLSDLAFLWMQHNAAKCGLTFDPPPQGEEPHPNPLGVLRDSRSRLFKLSRPLDRPIGALPKSNQSVDGSALERRERATNPAYHPSNLEAYLETQSQAAKPAN